MIAAERNNSSVAPLVLLKNRNLNGHDKYRTCRLLLVAWEPVGCTELAKRIGRAYAYLQKTPIILYDIGPC
jgi:hypothetical protein